MSEAISPLPHTPSWRERGQLSIALIGTHIIFCYLCARSTLAHEVIQILKAEEILKQNTIFALAAMKCKHVGSSVFRIISRTGLDCMYRCEACKIVIIWLTQFEVQPPVLYPRFVMLHQHQPSTNWKANHKKPDKHYTKVHSNIWSLTWSARETDE